MRKVLGVLVVVACAPDWSLPAPRLRPEVRVEPTGDLESAPAVLRLRVGGAEGLAPLADFRLYEGTLSSYYLGRLAKREPPSTLVEREVPGVVWQEGDDVLVAPARALVAGTYSLAAPDLGLLAEVTVDAERGAWVPRRWPPVGVGRGRGGAIFCGPEAAGVEPGALVLVPSATPARITRGVGESFAFAYDCVRLEPDDAPPEGTLLLPPALAGGAALEPLPLVVTAAEPLVPDCEDGEKLVGPGCVLVEDDRMRVRSPGGASLWAVSEPSSVLGVASPDASLVLRGLTAAEPYRFVASAFDLSGACTHVNLALVAAAETPHVVINEVLADPRGPETSGEWIELVNDGVSPVELGGFELRDTGAAVVLPAQRLEPGAFVLLADASFMPDPELDVPVVDTTPILRLTSLGQSGLSNAGELLRLTDAEGRVLSRFPSRKSPGPGQSLARVRPDAPDDEPASFAPHAEPGASPGAPNVVATP